MPVLTVKKCSPLSRLSGRATAAASRSATSVRRGHVDVGTDHDELVAAQARDGVGRAHRVGQPGRQREQHLVAGGVPERVVDGLEAVEVEHEDPDVDVLALPAGERVREPVERESAVGQPGERVVQAACRVTCSPRSRSTAMMMSVATAVRNAISSSENARARAR